MPPAATVSEEFHGTPLGTNDSNRTYQRTHPWIAFKLDLTRAPYQLWTLLGEACSKCEHISGIPLRPAVAEALHMLYLAKGARATTAIEGNTPSEEEASRRIRGIRDLPPSKEYLGLEVDNILKGCNEILEDLVNGIVRPISPERIKELNKIVLDRLDLEPGVVPEEIPTLPVGVPGYIGAPREDCDFLLGALCKWLDSSDFAELKCHPLGGAIFKSILAHLYLVWIHPFGDGNGRTARLIEYKILASSSVPSPAAHLLSNHYNETRAEYYRQLQRASQTDNGAVGFIVYSLQGLVDCLRAQIKVIRMQQLDVTWENYLHDKVGDRNTATQARRRHLVLDLSFQNKPVPRADLRRLTPRTAEAYASKTDKTLTRDITALEKMGLVKRTAKGILLCKEQILAFLPIAGPIETT